jgi:hypothetical protein
MAQCTLDQHCFAFHRRKPGRCDWCGLDVPRVAQKACSVCFALMHDGKFNEVGSMCKCAGYQHEVLEELRRRLFRNQGVPSAFVRILPELGLPAVADFIRANAQHLRVLEQAPPPPQLAQMLGGEDRNTYQARMMEQMQAMQDAINSLRADVRRLEDTLRNPRGEYTTALVPWGSGTSGSGGPNPAGP